MEQNMNEQQTTTTATDPMMAKRKRWLGIVIGGFTAIGIAYGAYWALHHRHYESTDNAYVQGNVVQITPQVARHRASRSTPTTPTS